ncbi:tyrosine-type recombinase/integrase [Microbacterium paludicola]|uniref:tyrosine-type recombinase/integrase n=1 Tax=Microbacterium paludicola TaxID=300019 RepID=UPI000903A09D|nr:tyrosine-type recombinase/integrase [Microbacterium paludicola]APF34650.1 hypothetical protein BO218_11000 [Microbacterium paludicola]
MERGDGGPSETTVRGKTVYRAKKYVGLVDGTDDEGKPVRRPKYVTGQGGTKQAAKKNLAKNLASHYRLAEEECLLPRSARVLTLASYYVDTWLPAAIASERYKTSDGLNVSRRRMEMHVLPALGSVSLRDLTPAEVKEFIEVTLPTKGLGAHTVTGIRETLSAVLADAIAEGRIMRHPMERIRWRSRAPRRAVDAPRGIIEAIRAETAGTQEEARWMLGLLLATRPGETLGLKWSAVEGVLDDRPPLLTVRRQLKWGAAEHAPVCKRNVNRKGWTCGKSSANCTLWSDGAAGGQGRLYLEESTKNSRIRFIPLTEPLIALLREQRDRQDTWRSADAAAWDAWERERPDLADLVFTMRNGRPRRQQVDSAALAAILTRLRKNGISAKFPPHDTRHIALTHMARDGVPFALVQQIAGHLESATTEMYIHLQAEDARDALDRVGATAAQTYRDLQPSRIAALRLEKERKAKESRAAEEEAYATWLAERNGSDGTVHFDPRTDAHPPLPRWLANWVPDDVRDALDQPGMKPESIALFANGILTLDEVARVAPLGVTDAAVARQALDDGIPDEYIRVTLG